MLALAQPEQGCLIAGVDEELETADSLESDNFPGTNLSAAARVRASARSDAFA